MTSQLPGFKFSSCGFYTSHGKIFQCFVVELCCEGVRKLCYTC